MSKNNATINTNTEDFAKELISKLEKKYSSAEIKAVIEEYVDEQIDKQIANSRELVESLKKLTVLQDEYCEYLANKFCKNCEEKFLKIVTANSVDYDDFMELIRMFYDLDSKIDYIIDKLEANGIHIH